ncbi:hypothetical protein BDV38DRAFT_263657, partial [Aspergillus pseudotamarii]
RRPLHIHRPLRNCESSAESCNSHRKDPTSGVLQTLQTGDANTTSSRISPPAVGEVPRMVGYQSQ